MGSGPTIRPGLEFATVLRRRCRNLAHGTDWNGHIKRYSARDTVIDQLHATSRFGFERQSGCIREHVDTFSAAQSAIISGSKTDLYIGVVPMVKCVKCITIAGARWK